MDDLTEQVDQCAFAANPPPENPNPATKKPEHSPATDRPLQNLNPPLQNHDPPLRNPLRRLPTRDMPPVRECPSRPPSPPPMVRAQPSFPYLLQDPNSGEVLEVVRDLVEDMKNRARKEIEAEESQDVVEDSVLSGRTRRVLEQAYKEMVEPHRPPKLRAPPPCPPSLVDGDISSASQAVLRRFVIGLQKSAAKQVVKEVQEWAEIEAARIREEVRIREECANGRSFLENLFHAVEDEYAEGISWASSETFVLGSESSLDMLIQEGYFGSLAYAKDLRARLFKFGFEAVEGSRNVYGHPSGLFRQGKPALLKAIQTGVHVHKQSGSMQEGEDTDPSAS